MKEYEINQDTLAIIPYLENKSKIFEKEENFIVDLSPMKIIDNSCKYFGSSYDGRFNGTKKMIGISHKSPIIIEETRSIIFFPTTSPRNVNCCWIALKNVENYEKINQNTMVIFSSNKTIKLDLSYQMFDNQILRATKLQATLLKRQEKVLNLIK